MSHILHLNCKYFLLGMLKRPSRRECNTRVRTPTPILMKFGPGVGFGLKPTPDNFFLDFDPKNGVILGSEGSKNPGFLKPFFHRKKSQGQLRKKLL